MKTFLLIVSVFLFGVCLVVGCDYGGDTTDNDPVYCTGDKADDPGCVQPDATESPHGDDTCVEDNFVEENAEESDVWKIGMDPCVPFAEYDHSCFDCGSGYICVQTTFILDYNTCGIQSSCLGLLYGDPKNPPPRFKDPTNYIEIQDDGNLLAHSTYPEVKDFICPPCN